MPLFVGRSITVPWAAYFGEPTIAGHLPTGTTTYDELSDITAALLPANAGHLWAVDDSANFILALRTSDMAARGQWTLEGVTLTETEAAASATIEGTSYLWLGGIGNNSESDATRTIWRVVEPEITGSNGEIAAGDIEAITINYDAEAPEGSGGTNNGRDAEALFADPATGDLYVVTKRTTVPQLFRLPWQETYSGTQTLEYLGDCYPLPTVEFTGTGASTGTVVSASISGDGTEILLRGYSHVFYFAKRPSDTFLEALQRTPVVLPAPEGPGPTTSWLVEPKGEAIAWDASDDGYFTLSEYVSGSGQTSILFPVWYASRASGPVKTVVLTHGANGVTGVDTWIDQESPNTTFFDGTDFDIDQGGNARDAFLRFDNFGGLAGITCVSATLHLHNVESGSDGSGTSLHRMLVDWYTGESLTWNTNPWSGGRVPADDTNAAATPADSIGTGTNAANVPLGEFRLFPSPTTVEGMVNGSIDNHGWTLRFLEPSGANGLNPKTFDGGTLIVPTHYDASQALEGDGESLATIADEIGGRDATGPVDHQPTLETGELNGLPVIRFTATGEQYLTADDVATDGAFTGDHALILLVRPAAIDYTGGPGGRVIVSTHAAGGANGDIYYVSGDTGFLHCLAASTDKLLVPADIRETWSMLVINRHRHGRTSVFRDGVLVSNQAHPLNASQVLFSIGQEWDSSTAGDFFDGDLAELVVVPRALSINEVHQATGYLAHKWGLRSNLPEGHPWRSAQPSSSFLAGCFRSTRPTLAIAYRD